MSAGKYKRAPEGPLGVTSSSSSGSSSGSDDDSPRGPQVALSPSTKLLQHHQQTQQLKTGSRVGPTVVAAVNTSTAVNPLPVSDDGLNDDATPSSAADSASAHDGDYDYYDAASSPSGSSTLSGPIYIRQPGFSEHAHSRIAPSTVSGQYSSQTVAHRPRVKKKKNSSRGSRSGERQQIGGLDDELDVAALPVSTAGPSSSSSAQDVGLTRLGAAASRQPVLGQPVNVGRSKTHRDPMPMRMRALPQSMWQEPNVPHNVSPATVYPILPPLVTREGEDIAALRPVTPPNDDQLDDSFNNNKTPAAAPKVSSIGAVGHDPSVRPRNYSRQQSERIITVANTDLLWKLFDVLKDPAGGDRRTPGQKTYGGHQTKKPACVPANSKKMVISSGPVPHKSLYIGRDPHLVENMADKLFPQLSLERSVGGGGGSLTARSTASTVTGGMTSSGPYGSGTMMVHLQPLPVGDKTILLPALSVDQNYPQMLSELVANI